MSLFSTRVVMANLSPQTERSSSRLKSLDPFQISLLFLSPTFLFPISIWLTRKLCITEFPLSLYHSK
ncbi:unnamed protein product, partial [Linum tenue]